MLIGRRVSLGLPYRLQQPQFLRCKKKPDENSDGADASAGSGRALGAWQVR